MEEGSRETFSAKVRRYPITILNWPRAWVAVIAMLLIRYLQLKARFNWSFSNLAYFLRMNLLVYRDLWDWLNNPFIPPDEIEKVPLPTQVPLAWS